MVDTDGDEFIANANDFGTILFCADWFQDRGDHDLAWVLRNHAMWTQRPAIPTVLKMMGHRRYDHYTAMEKVRLNGDRWALTLPSIVPLLRLLGWESSEEREVKRKLKENHDRKEKRRRK